MCYRLLLAVTPKAYMRSGQSERHVMGAPIRTRELSSRLGGQRRILTHFGASRLRTHVTHNITLKAVPFPIQVFVPIICLEPACLSLFGFDNESLQALSLVQPLSGVCWRNPDKIWTACMPQKFAWINTSNISKSWMGKQSIQDSSYSTLLFNDQANSAWRNQRTLFDPHNFCVCRVDWQAFVGRWPKGVFFNN